MKEKKMTTRDFNKILREFENHLQASGFSRESTAIYTLNDTFRLHFITDKWGWSEERGSMFVARLFDLRHPIGKFKLIHPKDQLDITPHYLIQQHAATEKDIASLYIDTPQGVQNQVSEGGWFVFYDEANLKSVLDKLLPLILREAKKWASRATDLNP